MKLIQDRLAMELQLTFPDTYKKIQENKKISSIQNNHCYYYILGFIIGLIFANIVVPTIININMSCNRPDRLFIFTDEER